MSEQQNPVLIDVSAGVGRIQFNRPESLNAISAALAESFNTAVHRLLSDPDVRVIVLSGSGRAFMAGGDLQLLNSSAGRASEIAHEMIGHMNTALCALASSEKLVIASLKGAVAGAGMSVALASDLAIAAEDVKFRYAYLAVGVTPDCSGSWTLVHAVGLRKALEIALLGEAIGAQEALRLGLVGKVVPAEKLDEETTLVAQRLAAGPPFALAGTKKLMRDAALQAFERQLDAERTSFCACVETEDFREGVDAFFAKRRPVFKGR